MKSICISLFTCMMMSFGCFAATLNQSTSSQSLNQFINLTAKCPKGCASCWDQCTKSSDCGSGHKCVGGACGNRCVAERSY